MRTFDKRVLYFNEEAHSYKDDTGFTYTSMTTVIGKYEEEFDSKKVAGFTSRKYFNVKGHRYYHMTPPMIIEYWAEINTNACNRGDDRHNYLEDAINAANGYKRVGEAKFLNDRIYTIDDIINDTQSFGGMSIDMFIGHGVDVKYPKIFKVIEHHINDGWKIYAEIGVYNPKLGVSGLVDVLMVKGKRFRILDWKTNKDEMHFTAGYYRRNSLGEFTTEWVAQPNKTFKEPLSNIQSCHGMTYTLQLSGYAYLIEQFGYTCDMLIIAHIRPKELDKHGIISNDKEDVIGIHNIEYIKEDVKRMFEHHFRVYGIAQHSLF